MSHRRHLVNAMKQMREAITLNGLYIKDRKDVYDNTFRDKIIGRCSSSVTYFAGVNSDGQVSHEQTQICHAKLASHRHEGDLKYIISRIQYDNNPRMGDISKDVIIAFLDWLTLHSPFASAFVYGGGERAYRRGFVIAHTDVPANLLAGAMFAHRAITEHNSRVMLSWYEMVSCGVHPSIAFCFAHLFAIGAEGVVFADQQSWHVSLPGGAMSKKYILDFKNVNMESPTQLYSKSKSYVGRVHSLWGNPYGDQHLINDIGDLLENIEKEVYKSSNVKNPFAAGSRMVNVIPVKEFFSLLSAMIIEEYGEDNK